MTSAPDGNSSSRKGRERRPILSLKSIERRSENSSQLPGIEQNDHNGIDAEIQDFEASLWQARNTWDIARRTLSSDAQAWLKGGGFAGRGKLSKADADNLLKRGLAAVAGAE